MDLQVLDSTNSSCVRRGFQATVYVASIMQNAVIDHIHHKVLRNYYKQQSQCIVQTHMYCNTALTSPFPPLSHAHTLSLPSSLQDCLYKGEKAIVRCRFLHHPEFVRVGSRLVMREGPTKATGEVTKLLPLKQTTPTEHTPHKHSR